MSLRTVSLAIWVGLMLVAGSAVADEVFFYPAEGQSSDQLEQDKMECYLWAKGQTGFDPMTPAPTPDVAAANDAAAATQGSAAQGAAKGAAVGAVGGAIGGNAGKGAAVGAGVGAVSGRRRANRNAANAQDQVMSDYEARLAAYNGERAKWQRAATACMEGRDYSVK